METVNLNLAHRWYIGYDWMNPCRIHSSLSKNSCALRTGAVQRFFERVVEWCMKLPDVGQGTLLQWTKVQADAAMESLVPRRYWRIPAALGQLFEAPDATDTPLSGRELVEKVRWYPLDATTAADL